MGTHFPRNKKAYIMAANTCTFPGCGTQVPLGLGVCRFHHGIQRKWKTQAAKGLCMYPKCTNKTGSGVKICWECAFKDKPNHWPECCPNFNPTNGGGCKSGVEKAGS